jgi:small redox-active disulfide protein 2
VKIEILGTGCPKCHTLATNARAAADKLGLPYELCKVTELSEIMKRGVVFTPAIAIDGQVKSAGKVLGEAELTTILTTAASE